MQAYDTDNYSIINSKNNDFLKLYKTEINIRKQLSYPPFSDIILIGISGENEKEVIEISNKLYDILKEDIGEQELYSPIPSPISKIKNNYRWRMIIKTKFNDDVIYILNNMLDEFEKMKNTKVKVIVDVNPNNMS